MRFYKTGTHVKPLVAALALTAALQPVLAKGIPKKVFHEFRNSLSSGRQYTMEVQMALFLPGKEPLLKKYKLFSKGDKALMVTLKPARDRGKMILMVKDQIWQYFPKAKKSININSALSVNTSANLSDLITSSLFQFYEGSAYEFDKKRNMHILVFKAKSRNAPYGKVRYFFKKRKIQHFEAYARSGILLKKIYFYKYLKNPAGGFYPAEIKVINALRENDYSLLKIKNIRAARIPDYYFHPASLSKVRE